VGPDRLGGHAGEGPGPARGARQRDLDVDAKVGGLSVASRQRVEIAKAISQDPRVLVMDEPTTSLAEGDVSG